MSGVMRRYIRAIERMNYVIGRCAMYLVFVLMGVLFWSSISKTFFDPSLWTLETAQFVMVTYYVLGGPYSIQIGAHVRMDLAYGNWSVTTKTWVDVFSVVCLLFYLGVLLQGAFVSLAYSLGYFGTDPYIFYGDLIHAFVTGGADAASEVLGHLERSRTAWRPYYWPIKVILVFGVILMLLQVLAELFKDIERLRGNEEYA